MPKRTRLSASATGARIVIAKVADTDNLTLYDSGDASANVGKLTSTEVTGLGMTLGVRYSDIEALNLWLSQGPDSFFIESTDSDEPATPPTISPPCSP